MSAQWQLAQAMLHHVREIDKDSKLFRCFTCSCWFDHGIQLDRNFVLITAEGIEQCPIAQIDLFPG
jgi:hypothetical protein